MMIVMQRTRLTTHSRLGFTLIELLIVISIIGILTALGGTLYATSQRNARDATRRTNVSQMQNVLEQYFTTNSSSYTNGCTNMSTLMPNGVPRDPQTGLDLGCSETSGGASYCVYADLELDTGNCTVSGTTCTMIITTTGTHVCQTALQ